MCPCSSSYICEQNGRLDRAVPGYVGKKTAKNPLGLLRKGDWCSDVPKAITGAVLFDKTYGAYVGAPKDKMHPDCEWLVDHRSMQSSNSP